MRTKEQKLKLKSIKILKILTKYGKEMDKYNIPYNVTFANQTAIKQKLTSTKIKERNDVSE